MKYQKGTTEWKEMNFELCKEEILALEGNPFVRDSAEIKAFCDEYGVDVGVGRDMYINKHYPTKEEKETIQEEWISEHKELCRKYYLNFIVEVQEFIKTEPVPFEETEVPAEVIE